jgi:hypothetical protein
MVGQQWAPVVSDVILRLMAHVSGPLQVSCLVVTGVISEFAKY